MKYSHLKVRKHENRKCAYKVRNVSSRKIPPPPITQNSGFEPTPEGYFATTYSVVLTYRNFVKIYRGVAQIETQKYSHKCNFKKFTKFIGGR